MWPTAIPPGGAEFCETKREGLQLVITSHSSHLFASAFWQALKPAITREKRLPCIRTESVALDQCSDNKERILHFKQVVIVEIMEQL